MTSSGRFLTPDLVLSKMERWCAYQDRCLFEVQQKLLEYELTEDEKICILEKLLGDKFLDEERFTESFISGKLKIKRWGRIKIRFALSQKKVDKQFIQKYLNAIDDELYLDILKSEFEKKKNLLKGEKDIYRLQAKVGAYLKSRGFESELIYPLLKNLKDS